MRHSGHIAARLAFVTAATVPASHYLMAMATAQPSATNNDWGAVMDWKFFILLVLAASVGSLVASLVLQVLGVL